jgi:hypothetical protein
MSVRDAVIVSTARTPIGRAYKVHSCHAGATWVRFRCPRNRTRRD